jgi:hypothetical protein
MIVDTWLSVFYPILGLNSFSLGLGSKFIQSYDSGTMIQSNLYKRTPPFKRTRLSGPNADKTQLI